MDPREEILKQQKLKQYNILNSFSNPTVEDEKTPTFESSLEKGLTPKNKWQKIINYKWIDAITNGSFKEYVSKELGTDDFDNISFTERERLLRDKDYISKGEEDDLNKKEKLIEEFIKGNSNLDDNEFHYFAKSIIPNKEYAEETVYKILNEELEKAEIGSIKKLQGKQYQKQVGGDWVSLIKAEEMGEINKTSLEDVLKKWNLPADGLKEQIELGLGVEKEHSKDIDILMDIICQHLLEDKEYYTKAKPKDWAKKEINKEEQQDVEKSIIADLEKGLPPPREGETRNWKDGLYKFVEGHWRKQSEPIRDFPKLPGLEKSKDELKWEKNVEGDYEAYYDKDNFYIYHPGPSSPYYLKINDNHTIKGTLEICKAAARDYLKNKKEEPEEKSKEEISKLEDEIFKILKEIKDNPNKKNSNGQTPNAYFSRNYLQSALSKEAFNFLNEDKSKYGKLTYGDPKYSFLDLTTTFREKYKETPQSKKSIDFKVTKERLEGLVKNIVPAIKNDQQALTIAAKYQFKTEEKEDEVKLTDIFGTSGTGKGFLSALEDYSAIFMMKQEGIDFDDIEIDDDGNTMYGFEKGNEYEGEIRHWKDGDYKYENGHWKKQIKEKEGKKEQPKEKSFSKEPKEKYKREVFKSIPIKINDIIWNPETKPGYYGTLKIYNISGGIKGYATVAYVSSINGNYSSVGSKFPIGIETIQKMKDIGDRKKHEQEEDIKEIEFDILKDINFDKIQGGNLNSSPTISELRESLNKLIENTKKYSKKDESVPAGGFHGANSMTMRSSQSGTPIKILYNDIHRGGYYEGSTPFLIQIQVGGALDWNIKEGLLRGAKQLLSKFNYETSLGKSYIRETHGTNWSAIMLTAPNNNKEYSIINI